MFTSATRRVFSVLVRSTSQPRSLLCPVTSSTTTCPRSTSLLTTTTPSIPRLHHRTFARRSYDSRDDDDDLPEEDDTSAPVEEELEDEDERRQARGPSKAMRLRLKEKEKRRQKLAMRERVDNKKDKGLRAPRGRRGRAMDDEFDEDDAVDLFDEFDEGDEGVEGDTAVELEQTQADALVADKQRKKKEMLMRRFEGPEAERDEEDDEVEKTHDKDAERPVNEAITAPAIVLIDGAGKRIGLVSTAVALRKARDSQLDIVTLSPPQVTPPICRVVDYADWLAMERQRKGQDEPTKRAKTVQVRKLIDQHDLETKATAMRRFLQLGHAVRVQYFEKNAADGEWTELFGRVAALVDGVGVSQDLVSKPIAVFEPVRKKKDGEDGKQAKTEKVKKEPQQSQKQQQQQLGETAVQEEDGGGAPAPAEEGTGRPEVQQHAKAGGE